MEKLTGRLALLKQANGTLKMVIDELQRPTLSLDNAKQQEIMYTLSLIKQFELCYDLVWKCGKDFLRVQYGVEVAAPKKVFQELRRNGIVDDEDAAILAQMVDDRNQTAHIYDQLLAVTIGGNVGLYYEIIEKIIEKLKIT